MGLPPGGRCATVRDGMGWDGESERRGRMRGAVMRPLRTASRLIFFRLFLLFNTPALMRPTRGHTFCPAMHGARCAARPGWRCYYWGGGTPSFRRAHLPYLPWVVLRSGKVWVGCDVGTGSRRGECVTQDPTRRPPKPASSQQPATRKGERGEGDLRGPISVLRSSPCPSK
jgi:hypothetical protein